MAQIPVSDLGLDVEHVTGRARMPDAHRHGEIEINFIRNGGLSYIFGPDMVTLDAGAFCAFWAVYPHRVVAETDDLQFYWMTIPLTLFLSWGMPQDLVDALMQGQLVQQARNAEVGPEEIQWQHWATEIKDRAARGFAGEVLLWEIRARLGRFSLNVTKAGQGRPRRRSEGLSRGVGQMVRFIGEHFREPIKVADVAAYAKLNPNYATEAFRRAFGLGIKDYLMRQRIAEAQRLLLSSDKTVLETAFLCGFSSPSRFHEWFRRLSGKSPEQYRREHNDMLRSS